MAEASVNGYTPRLRKHYDEVVRPKLVEEFGYKNPMQVPTIDKIVINMGIGESVADSKKASSAAGDLALHRGSGSGDHPCPQGDLVLQGAREHADRLQSDVTQGPDVRVPRPPGQYRAAARA